ncbi:unnamed protein product, partial [Durusdinium trenchii]
MVFNNPSLDWSSPSDHVELFRRGMSITKGEWQEQRDAVPMDLRYSSDHDILSNQGFLNMVYQILNLRPGSGHFTAPVCSTWVFLRLCWKLRKLNAPRSRGSTGRSESSPLGWDYDSVLLLAQRKKIWWILEQPINSLMERHPLFVALMRLMPIRRMPTAMSWFGGATRKPTWLYSSHAEIDRVNDYADRTLQGDNTTREMVVPYQDRRGRRRIKGGRDLKNSQAYP